MNDMGKSDKNTLDETDLEILNLLKQNAKAKMQDIGNKVHLTGQAVSNRVSRLEKIGVIKGYSVILDSAYTPSQITAFIKVHMKTLDHASFRKWCQSKKEITEAHRISGDGCYLLKAETPSQEVLNALLDEVLVYANYSLNISIDAVKS